VKCHHHASSLEWYFDSGIIPYIDFNCLKKGAKTLGREALKTGLNIVEDVVAGKNLKQTAKSRLKSTGQSLLQKAIIGVGLPGERSIKRAAKLKKPTRRQKKSM
jgi:hypothetical protein